MRADQTGCHDHHAARILNCMVVVGEMVVGEGWEGNRISHFRILGRS